MASPTTITITLNANDVIIEDYTDGLVEPIGNSSVGKIVQAGSDVTDWAVDDVIFYPTNIGANFKADETTYRVFDAQYIYFKYVAVALP